MCYLLVKNLLPASVITCALALHHLWYVLTCILSLLVT